jgi:uncharacterized protein YdhG (YjbR/CyaY superfamily)
MKGRLDVDSPEAYLAALDEPRREQVASLDRLIREAAPSLTPHIASGMLAYGRYHYRYESGREGEWFIIGLASNKGAISLYVSAGDGTWYLAESYADRLGKVSVGKSCVRIKRLEDVDLDALRELIAEGARRMGDMPGVTVLD